MPRPHLPHPRRTAELLITQLGEAGIEVEILESSDVADYLQKVVAGDYDLALTGWIPDTPDLSQLFETLLGTEGIPETARSAISRANLARWSDAAMDAALLDYRKDPSAKNLLEIGEILNQERPLLPLMYGSQIVVNSWRLKNRPAAFFNRPFFTEMTL